MEDNIHTGKTNKQTGVTGYRRRSLPRCSLLALWRAGQATGRGQALGGGRRTGGREGTHLKAGHQGSTRGEEVRFLY